ncbi:MAG: hypothetical protein ACLR56_01680 [Oscillospiraceae bacterium]
MQKSEHCFDMIAAIGIVILLAGIAVGSAFALRRRARPTATVDTLKTNAENTIIFLMRTMRKVL